MSSTTSRHDAIGEAGAGAFRSTPHRSEVSGRSWRDRRRRRVRRTGVHDSDRQKKRVGTLATSASSHECGCRWREGSCGRNVDALRAVADQARPSHRPAEGSLDGPAAVHNLKWNAPCVPEAQLSEPTGPRRGRARDCPPTFGAARFGLASMVATAMRRLCRRSCGSRQDRPRGRNGALVGAQAGAGRRPRPVRAITSTADFRRSRRRRRWRPTPPGKRRAFGRAHVPSPMHALGVHVAAIGGISA